MRHTPLVQRLPLGPAHFVGEFRPSALLQVQAIKDQSFRSSTLTGLASLSSRVLSVGNLAVLRQSFPQALDAHPVKRGYYESSDT